MDNIKTMLLAARAEEPHKYTWIRGGCLTSTLLDVTFGIDMFVAVGMKGNIITSEDGQSWTRREASNAVEDIHAVIYGDGRFVAVGRWGTLLTSTDGVEWFKHTIDFFEHIYDVVYYEGTYTAVGSAGSILTSPNGITWTVHPSLTSETLLGIAVSDGKYVAVGSAGTIFMKTGATWVQKTVDIFQDLFCVIFAMGQIFAAGAEGTLVFSQDDGETWFKRITNTGVPLYDFIEHDNELLLVGGEGTLLTSKTGFKWTKRDVDATLMLSAITFGNEQLLCVSEQGQILRTGEPVAIDASKPWSSTRRLSLDTGHDIQDFDGRVCVFGGPSGVAYGGFCETLTGRDFFLGRNNNTTGQFIFPASQGAKLGDICVFSTYYYGTSARAVFWSSDMENWYTSSQNGLKLVAVASGSGVFLGYGEINDPGQLGHTTWWKGFMTSINGQYWHWIGTIGVWNSYGNIRKIRFFDDKFIAAGDIVAAITIGDTWQTATISVWFSDKPINDLVKHPTQNLYIGVRSSTNAVHFNSAGGVNHPITNNTNTLNGICHANNLFVAVGANGVIMTSPNGSSWTIRATFSGITLNCVSHVKGIFLAVGSSASFATSEDGINWTYRVRIGGEVNPNRINCAQGKYYLSGAGGSGIIEIGETSERLAASNSTIWGGIAWRFLIYANNRYIAGGHGSGGSPSFIVSFDAVTWNIIPYINYINPFSVAAGKGVVVVGAERSIQTTYDGFTYSIHYPLPYTNASWSYWGHDSVGAIFAKNRFVLVGYYYNHVSGTSVYTKSTHISFNGFHWVTTMAASGSGGFTRIAFGKGVFVATGWPEPIGWSLDGISWVYPAMTAHTYRDICYGHGKFVAVGDAGRIAISSDGKTWEFYTISWEQLKAITPTTAGFIIATSRSNLLEMIDVPEEE